MHIACAIEIFRNKLHASHTCFSYIISPKVSTRACTQTRDVIAPAFWPWSTKEVNGFSFLPVSLSTPFYIIKWAFGDLCPNIMEYRWSSHKLLDLWWYYFIRILFFFNNDFLIFWSILHLNNGSRIRYD